MDRLEIIEGLKDTPHHVSEEIAGLSDSVLRYRPAEGEWSIKETVGHMRNAAEVWHKRLHATATLTDPRMPLWDAVIGDRDTNFQDADLSKLIAEMAEWRQKTIETLVHAVDWTRLGQHAEIGRRSLKQWAEYVLAHDQEHLATIRTLKSAQTTRQPA
jgi:uncharacterized damage-inducible protein DinB